MSRLHIAARLGLIVVGAIILVQLLSVAIYFVEQRGRGEPSGFAALFAQVAALAEAIDRVPRDDRDLVLRAATTARFKPVVRQDVPPNPLARPTSPWVSG